MIYKNQYIYTVDFEFTFSDLSRGNLDEINQALSECSLDDVTVAEHTGALVTEKKFFSRKRYYALQSCKLHCHKDQTGEGMDFQIDTMIAEKTVSDCAALWQQNHPDRKLCKKVFCDLGDVYALVVVHHDIRKKRKEREIIPTPGQYKPVEVPKPVVPKPVISNSVQPPKPVAPPKPTAHSGKAEESIFWRFEDGTLYIEGTGRLRCSRYNWDQGAVRHVIIAPGCTAIADFVFQNHENLESIDLPDTLRTIGQRAFSGCVMLREVRIPDSVIGIGKGAFAWCQRLEKVQLPRNLTQIHDDTFYYCENLENVQIPNDVHYIGSRAFYRVKSVNNLPWNLGNWGTKTPAYCNRRCGLGVAAFKEAGLPAHIEIPHWLYSIPEEAFYECKTLVSVKFPYYMEEIGGYAFAGCKQLECLEIPKSVTQIGSNAFWRVPRILYNGSAQSNNNWGANRWERDNK